MCVASSDQIGVVAIIICMFSHENNNNEKHSWLLFRKTRGIFISESLFSGGEANIQTFLCYYDLHAYVMLLLL